MCQCDGGNAVVRRAECRALPSYHAKAINVRGSPDALVPQNLRRTPLHGADASRLCGHTVSVSHCEAEIGDFGLYIVGWVACGGVSITRPGCVQ